MPLQYDPEWHALAGPTLEASKEILPVNDVPTRRTRYEKPYEGIVPTVPDDIEMKVLGISASDGHEIAIYCLSKKRDDSPAKLEPAVLHMHGGGFISVRAHHAVSSLVPFVSQSGVRIFTIDYRRAPEYPFPTPLEDCWSGLLYLQSNAEILGIDTSRIAVWGESAGGALAASLTLLARERGFSPPLAKQILMYPMIDDRTVTDHTGGLDAISINDVITAWTAYLGKAYGTDNLPSYASPGRVSDVKGLPPLYLDVGQLDLFLHEDIAYAQKFLSSGIQAELHVYPGVIHAFQRWSPNSQVVKQAFTNRLRAITSL
ncbi:hypothetical protein PMIN01_12131 [Paraphaeosphaeria minitans]|uniref:Alpha/beta hydrolase fold-3 domain-containing protein n=1 Tax=Paraphaeosphaeria minitans TaxID=565426 RepID=A0A9P6G806_9PLEO|nr:hypothetical protein PMIN01_12131 [Paraphaeosphaeria minitans]